MTKSNIPPDGITKAKMETGGQSTVPVQKDALQPDPLINQKLGLVGKLFGYGNEKPGNIAGIIGLIGLVGFFYFGSVVALGEGKAPPEA
ncbi:hypothetical protein, partial [Roseibium sp. TrichSKD4]|uniref:hypothetical protein n=1 Tax=Roseibium sp. TrichSKD4 TaxID=744980 RepID=UPI00058C78BE